MLPLHVFGVLIENPLIDLIHLAHASMGVKLQIVLHIGVEVNECDYIESMGLK